MTGVLRERLVLLWGLASFLTELGERFRERVRIAVAQARLRESGAEYWARLTLVERGEIRWWGAGEQTIFESLKGWNDIFIGSSRENATPERTGGLE
jgi:hypothetical protein